VATLEAAKGLLVLLLGLGLLDLLHRDVEEAAENLLSYLRIGVDRRVARVSLDAASKLTDARLWALTGTAVAYAGVRFTEAWGLWNRRQRDIEYVSALALGWPVKSDKAEATYEHGLLRIEVPIKDPIEDAVKVAIKAGGAETKTKTIEVEKP
jgi:hypothetical protein